jgi:putative ABC transport system permease protein
LRQLTIAWKDILHRPMRSLLTTSALAVAVAAVISLVGISSRFEQSFRELYEQQDIDLVVQRAGGTVQLSSGIDESIGRRMEKLPQVRQVIGSLMDMVSFEQFNLYAVIVNGWPPDSPVLHRVTIKSGRRLVAGDKFEVMLGETLAANLGKHVGDSVEIYAQPFEVVGIFESFSIWENGAVFMMLDELQQLMSRPHHVTGYVVKVDKSTDDHAVEKVQREIEALDPTLSAMPTGEFVRNIAQIKLVRSMAWITSLIALVIGTVGISNTMLMSVFERQTEIGVLGAIGWRNWRIVRLVLSESLALSLLGATVGSIGGVLIIRLLSWLPMSSGLVDGKLSPMVILDGFALAIAAGLLGAAYPAYWVANLTPLAALRRK